MTAAPERDYALLPPPPGTRRRTGALLGAILLAVSAAVSVADRRAALATLPAWLLVAAVVEVSVRQAARGRVTLGPSGIRVRAPLAAQTIRWDLVHADGVRVVDLAHERELAPRWRQMGLGLAGYRSGYFALRGGRDALVAIADGAPAVVVPWGTRGLLLLTPEHPEAFADEVRQRAAPA